MRANFSYGRKLVLERRACCAEPTWSQCPPRLWEWPQCLDLCWVPEVRGRSHPVPFPPCRAASVPVICFLHLVFEKVQFGEMNVKQKGPSGLPRRVL